MLQNYNFICKQPNLFRCFFRTDLSQSTALSQSGRKWMGFLILFSKKLLNFASENDNNIR